MANVNPMQLISMLRGGNPQTIAMQLVKQNFPNDPTMNSLIEMGQKGDVKGVEEFAKQYFGQQGKNFEQEMSNFMQMLKGL